VDPLATLADLQAREIEHDSSEVLSTLLGAASSSVRDAAGSPISRGTWTIAIPGRPDQWLTVPIQPVVSVTGVKLDGVELADGEWRLVGGRLWRARGWWNGCEPAEITATVTGGLDPVPADIVDLVCAMVGAALARLEDGYETRSDLAYVSVDDYREGYLTSAGERLAGVMELPEATRRRLAARFGGSAVVVGSGR